MIWSQTSLQNFFFNIFNNAADKKATYEISRYQLLINQVFNQYLKYFTIS